jgi:hypothetical protein
MLRMVATSLRSWQAHLHGSPQRQGQKAGQEVGFAPLGFLMKTGRNCRVALNLRNGDRLVQWLSNG